LPANEFKAGQHGRQLEDDLPLLIDAAQRAGQIAMKFFRANPKTWTKGADSPVTEADIAVDRYLRDRLCKARPTYGWLSEESEDDGARIGRQFVFVIDPIDGTRAYVKGSDQWTISLAVVCNGRPVAAALARPATGQMYHAAAGLGAFLDNKKMSAKHLSSLAGVRLAGPKAVLADANFRDAAVEPVPYIPSLALRLAYVAQGHIDAAAARGRSQDWDLAAADLLVQEAGGVLSDIDGAPIVYNRADTHQPALVAASVGLHSILRPLLKHAGLT
jgi:myo-inositol-1(or 4)-monophosphatase